MFSDGRREPQCSGIIIKQLSDGSGRHRAMVMTHSGVVCVSGRIRDPVPKVQTFPFSDWRLYVVFHSVVPIISSPSTCMNQPPRAYCILGKMFSLDILCYEYKMWHLFVWPSLCKCASIQIFSCFTIVWRCPGSFFLFSSCLVVLCSFLDFPSHWGCAAFDYACNSMLAPPFLLP